jgi:hypothetical protein
MSDQRAFATTRLPAEPTEIARDGSAVRVFLGTPGGTLAHFELQPGETSHRVAPIEVTATPLQPDLA